jgi:hypothetical protein
MNGKPRRLDSQRIVAATPWALVAGMGLISILWTLIPAGGGTGWLDSLDAYLFAAALLVGYPLVLVALALRGPGWLLSLAVLPAALLIFGVMTLSYSASLSGAGFGSRLASLVVLPWMLGVVLDLPIGLSISARERKPRSPPPRPPGRQSGPR